nr:ribonuclease H-like domain-containing protein [Tanacetum cinerariifolium]
MTWNMFYLTEYKEIDGEYVAFGRNPKRGKITRKCTIRNGTLDFVNVYFVRELKFNFFNVLQMCDEKNNVPFNNTECIVLSPNFKLIGESQVLLRVPRKNNMNSFYLKNIVLKGGLTCLFAKATSDESKLWHRRLGHLNFKSMNKLVKGNIVRVTKNETSGILKSSITGIENLVDYKVNVIRYGNGTEFKKREMNQFCEMKGKFNGKADEGFFVRYSLNSKGLRVFNSRTRIVEENLHIRFSENTPNVVISRADWLFDINVLTRTINYEPIVADQKKEDNVNSTNNVNAAGISKVNNASGNASIKLSFDSEMPVLEDISTFNFSNDDEDDFLSTTMVETINGEAQIHARVDGKKPKRKDTQVPQISAPTESVADKVVYKELDDRLVRAATTASSIESERVKKLKKKQRSRTHKLMRLYKVGLTARVESSDDEQSLGEDASKQGRIRDIDSDEGITLVSTQVDAEMFDADKDFGGEEVFVEQDVADKEEISKVTLAQRLKGLLLKSQLKEFEFDKVQEMFNKAFKRVHTSEDFRTELVQGEGKEKRAGEELVKEVSKKQKANDDKETAELKQLMEIILDEEEVTINAIPLAVKSPKIVD